MASVKNILIGSLCVALSQVTHGLMEVMVKASEMRIAQFVIARYIIELILASLWWKWKTPVHASSDNKNMNWYRNFPYIINIWIRGMIVSTNFITLYAVCMLPLGDFQTIFYHAPLLTVLCA